MESRKHQLAALLTIAALSICAVIQLHDVTRIIPPAWSDLYSPWKASQAALHHDDPYSTGVTNQIQTWFYGRVLGPDDLADPQSFVYPAHMVLFLAPLTFLPWFVVRLAFVVVAPFAIAGTLWIWLKLADIKLTAARAIFLYGLVLTSWPAVWAYQQQQPTIIIFAVISLAILAFSGKRDVAAGALLALATVKPNLVALTALWLFLFAASSRRWKFIGSFIATVATLVGLSELVAPGWIREWLHAGAIYTHQPGRVSLLIHLFGSRIGLAMTVVLLAAAAVRLSYKKPSLFDSAALVLSITVCTIPTTMWMNYNNLLLIPAALMSIASTPSNSPQRILQFFTRVGLGWLAFAAPLTILLEVLTHRPLPKLPFLEFNVVFCIMVCTFSRADRRTVTRRVLQAARPIPAAPSLRNSLP